MKVQTIYAEKALKECAWRKLQRSESGLTSGGIEFVLWICFILNCKQFNLYESHVPLLLTEIKNIIFFVKVKYNDLFIQ